MSLNASNVGKISAPKIYWKLYKKCRTRDLAGSAYRAVNTLPEYAQIKVEKSRPYGTCHNDSIYTVC
jgi:hypothetical protein